ncbi:amidohydrolase family protein [Peptoniphilus asaccharolyticus]
MKASFIIKGDICYSKDLENLITKEDSYLICLDGVSKGVFDHIPEEYRYLKVYDYSGKIVMPGLVDLHVHAPQYHFRGLGMDLELLDWLNTYTFPHEAKYADIEYAKKTYSKFVGELEKSTTTRAVVFATLHVPSTILLMNMLEESGLVSYVGKVNMDRNSIPELQEQSAAESAESTIKWLEEIKSKFKNTYPIITPRFTPSCTDDLMEKLGDITREYKLPVQSHLSENQGEIAWVRELCPGTKCYGESYDRYGIFGREVPTIMAHCVWSDEYERNLLKDRGVYIAHCPDSNMNLASGIAPIRRYLTEGQRVGLGSDVAGGAYLSIFRQMTDAIQVSKLFWRLVDEESKPLIVEEVFYLGTLGGGEFFGKVGSFEDGYEFDAVVIDDAEYRTEDLNLHQRLERTIYLSANKDIAHKFIRGNQIF